MGVFMKLAKKITTIATILATAITGLILILLLFKVKMFGDSNSSVLFTMATLGIGGFFAINSMNMLSKNKIIGWVSLGLILASVFLIVLAIWLDLNSNMYARVTICLGLLSVLFNVIVSSGLSLGRTKMFWQVIVYIVVGITDIVASLIIFGVLDLVGIGMFLLMLIIMSVIGVIILKILSKKAVEDLVEVSKNMVKISKSEYEMLVEKAKKYDEMFAKENNNNN
jgi:hypothetical protein